MKKLAIYPGSFDPPTYGHIDLIKRALKVFDQLIVAVARNTQKETLFTVEERLAMLKQALKGIRGVSVDSFDGLVVRYVRSKNTNVVIRGLRMLSDFEYEFQMALTNRRLAKDIETVFLMPSEAYSYISSRLIKEAASLGADIRDFVPGFIAKQVERKLKA